MSTYYAEALAHQEEYRSMNMEPQVMNSYDWMMTEVGTIRISEND